MNICFLNKFYLQYPGGIETYTAAMSRILAQKGHTVHILTAAAADSHIPEVAHPRIFIHQIPEPSLKVPGLWRLADHIPFNRYFYARAVVQKLKSIQQAAAIDIIESPETIAEGVFCLGQMNIPLVARLHGYFPIVEMQYKFRPLSLSEKLLASLQSKLIDGAQTVLAVSHSYAEFARAFWKIKRPDLDVLVHGLDTERFSFKDAPREKRILFVGRMDENKGINILCEAYKIIFSKYPDLEFVFAGVDTLVPNASVTWKAHIQQALPRARLNFLGPIPQEKLIDYYQRSLIAVFPSRYEPFGLVALEAMACGCVTIASRIGGFEEIIEDGKDGFLVSPGDPGDLVKIFEHVLKHPEKRHALTAQAVLKVKTQFALNTVADRLLEHYSAAIQNYSKKKS